MIATPDNIIDVSKAIQLALAPAFLLTGIAGMLNVMAARLARIIDRGRVLTESHVDDILPDKEAIHLELKDLERRRYFTSVAITSCTISALLLCMIIGTLFLEVVLAVPLKWLIGTLFSISTLALVVGLACFLREVHLAMKTLRISISDKS